MAITNFQRTIWSKQIEKSLATITSLRNHCSFKHQSETPGAKEIKILNVVRPTIRTYVPGTPLTREGATDGSMLLKIDQFKYFDFEVDDVEKAQSTPGLMEALSDEASRGLAEEGDKYVASIIEAGVEDATTPLAQSSSVITLTKQNAMEELEKGFAVLYGNNVKVSDNFYWEVAPSVYTIYRQFLTETSTDNPEILKKGAVGKINNAYVTIENLLPTGKTGTGTADDTYYNVLRTDKAIDFVEQIDKVEAYRPQDAFSDALKGLYCFGALITRPEEIYVMKTAM